MKSYVLSYLANPLRHIYFVGFADAAAAQRYVANLPPGRISYVMTEPAAMVELFSGPRLVELYNEFASDEEQVTKFRDLKTGAERVWKILKKNESNPTAPAVGKEHVTIPPLGGVAGDEPIRVKTPRAVLGSKAFPAASRIKILVPNPKKPGSKSHALFELYHEGMTVGEFLLAGGTHAAIRWDQEHKYIDLEPTP